MKPPEPEPDYPVVERILPGTNSYWWTFSSEDWAVQQREFSYWMGWFGFDKDDHPDRIEGSVWYIRKRHA